MNHRSWQAPEPSVLVFDVNETLIDLESMSPLFERIFGDGRVLREWFGHLITYSMTITLSGLYEGSFTLGQGLLRMVGGIHGVQITDTDIEELRTGMLTMPAHPDVEPGLSRLKEAGFRLVTLTNSPSGPSPLEHAGLADFFERQFTIETTRAYKPAPQAYHLVTQALGVPASACFMVAVIATTRSPQRFAMLEELGAERAELEGPELSGRIAEAKRLDAMLDLVGNSTILDSLALLRRGGRACLAGRLGGLDPIPDFNPLLQMASGVHLTFFGSFVFGTPGFPLSDVSLQSIAEQVAAGRLRAKPSRVFYFNEVREAHRVMEAGQAKGKMVVVNA
jgi:2-haloalkanoic acid dehalogenase type II